MLLTPLPRPAGSDHAASKSQTHVKRRWSWKILLALFIAIASVRIFGLFGLPSKAIANAEKTARGLNLVKTFRNR